MAIHRFRPEKPDPEFDSYNQETRPGRETFDQQELDDLAHKKALRKKLTVFVAFPLFTLFLGFTLYTAITESIQLSRMSLHECVENVGEGRLTTVREADCTDVNKDSLVVISAKRSKTAEADCKRLGSKYVRFYATNSLLAAIPGKRTGSKPPETRCLEPNLHVGACYLEVPAGSLKMVPCDEQKRATFKVASQLASGITTCPTGSEAFTLRLLTDRMLCLSRP